MDRFDEIAASLFLEGKRLAGRYDPPAHEAFAPMPGVAGIWQAPVFPPGSDSARLLRVYLFDGKTHNIRRAHWSNEARSLLRLSSSGHPALPKLHEASLVDEKQFGYLILDDPGSPVVADHPLRTSLVARPSFAFQRWFSLIEALMLIHDEAMMHRSLTPLATCALLLPDTQVVVDGFQMSAFVSTWLRRGGEEGTAVALDGLDPDLLACMAPERLGPLLGQRRKFIESFRTDVFSLGMIGAWWLTGAKAGWAHGLEAKHYTEEKHREVIAGLRAQVVERGLPRPLRSLLESMMAFEPGGRIPSGRAVYDEAARLFGTVLREMEEPEGTEQVYRVYYLKETMDRFYADQRTRTHPSAPDYLEYDEAIVRDLDGATMTWSAEGFDPWELKKKDEKTRQAKIVLLGREYAYFSQYLDQGTGGVEKRAIVVKYFVPVHQARALRTQPKVRALPRVEARFFQPGKTARTTRPIPASAPSWDPLVGSIEFADAQGPAAPIIRAGNWLLGAQRAISAANEYQYKRLETDPHTIILEQHPEPDLPPNDTEDGAFLSLYREARPPALMGRSFEAEWRHGLDTGETPEFLLRTELRARDEAIRLAFKSKLDDHTVQFESKPDGDRVPREGYIRASDAAMLIVQSRQKSALRDLERRQHHLAAQLANPTALELKLTDPPACLGLEEQTRALVRKILETWPLFVLQGPPGTGKTFVARHSIEAILEADPFARILVSAQSHHALDNLLEEVVGASKEGHEQRLLVRIASSRTQSKVGDTSQAYLPDKVVAAIVEELKKPLVGAAKSTLGALAKEWRGLAMQRRIDADLAQRLVRSVALVFVTCAGAGSPAIRGTHGATSFDWVIVEEAARGWFTEILVPMVQGARWLLIGDHAQLPAFQAGEIADLLAKDAEVGTTAIATGVKPDAEWKKYFKHFEHLMQAPELRGISSHATIDVQRRMHPDIAALVSEAYYKGILNTHPDAKRAHGFREPTFLRDTALVWIDTSKLGVEAHESREQDGLTNNTEIDLVRRLLTHVGKAPEHDKKIPPIILLSPYKAQVRLLIERAQEVPKNAIHTVDSVQGRQAEVVIVSLVRNNFEEGERAGIGFMAEPERANVMFSRARRLLVIVGALEHFERFKNTHWSRVATIIRSQSRFLVDPIRDLNFQPRRR
ncbi:MAG: AAA domain-containing protein [Byssovorax sp.]